LSQSPINILVFDLREQRFGALVRLAHQRQGQRYGQLFEHSERRNTSQLHRSGLLRCVDRVLKLFSRLGVTTKSRQGSAVRSQRLTKQGFLIALSKDLY